MDDRTPVLIGAGQFTYRGEPQSAPAPTRLLKIAALGAAQDAGLAERDLATIDSLAVVGFTWLNIAGVHQTRTAQKILTSITVFGLVFIIAIGLAHVFQFYAVLVLFVPCHTLHNRQI